jgi:hypothetical protein
MGLGALVLVALAGCVTDELLDTREPGPTVVPSSPFGDPGPATPRATRTAYAPASAEVAMRVDRVGRQICAANPQASLHPNFAIYGSPKPEIFHQGTKVLHLTDSLVQGCKTDPELAAVLCLELARMVAEREALSPARNSKPDERPPISVPIGNAGQIGAFDQAHMAELARYEERQRAARQPKAVPDPQALAGTFLENAGYPRIALDSVQPLLKAAEGNYVLEKQFKTSGAAGWAPGP